MPAGTRGEKPAGARMGTPAGLFCAVGVNAAIYRRQQTGEGTKVDVGMLDAQVAILENAIARYGATGENPGPLGSRHPSIAPFDAFATADGYVVIAAGNDALFGKLCEVLDRSDLAENPLFATNEHRTTHNAALKDEMESVLQDCPTTHWLKVLKDAGIPSGPINEVDMVIADPQVAARNMIISLEDSVAGNVTVAGNPIKISTVPDPKTREPAPDLDADRSKILSEL